MATKSWSQIKEESITLLAAQAEISEEIPFACQLDFAIHCIENGIPFSIQGLKEYKERAESLCRSQSQSQWDAQCDRRFISSFP